MRIKFPLAFGFGIGICAGMMLLIIVNYFVQPENFQHFQEVFGGVLLAGLFMVGFSVVAVIDKE